ncbi:MAG: dienelactone hydrolase family protein [Candidatus Eisenbacteria bacterium]|uniref:Dienelactone hydrolase family protein n=1 Tax=Eiseniibacteriota bacterium TaxID=2212470 RepID=A0A956M173_UNCEI|nr:dienelactone hydrolase family protein [Candidatus Eisenbacteria bacterium]
MSGSRVTVPVNGRSIEAYVSPAVGGRGPGIIVIQEWWGLVPHIEAICDRYASEGFTALAPDLYHGKTTKSPDEAGKLLMALDVESAARDLRSAISYLLDHSATLGSTVGSVGFCMGGMLSLFAAGGNPEVAACIDYYGVHPNIHPDFGNMQSKVLGFFGAEDQMVSPPVVRELEAKLKAAGRSAEFHTYDGAGHAFFNDERPEAYVESAATDSWNRSLAFFRVHLANNGPGRR